MSDDLIRAVQGEIAKLEAELERDVRIRRLQSLRGVLKLYQSPTAEANFADLFLANAGVSSRPSLADYLAAVTKQEDESSITPSAAAKRGGRQASPERERALQAARILVTNRSGPVTTREILEYLDSLAIPVGGENPLNNLSAMLSNSNQFKSHGRSGWTLVDDEPSPEPIDESIYSDVAEIVLSDIESDTLREMFDAESKAIPREHDGKLLALARDKAGRQLTSDERNLLRDAFWANLKRAII